MWKWYETQISVSINKVFLTLLCLLLPALSMAALTETDPQGLKYLLCCPLQGKVADLWQDHS